MPIERLVDLRMKRFSRRGVERQREERLTGTVRPTGFGESTRSGYGADLLSGCGEGFYLASVGIKGIDRESDGLPGLDGDVSDGVEARRGVGFG